MWSNRETKALYETFLIPDTPNAYLIAKNVLDDLNGKPDYWSDYERIAIRDLAKRLRDETEAAFEDFYFGPPEKRSRELAHMCSSVGSLWRVNWTELAERVFDGAGLLPLEPPE